MVSQRSDAISDEELDWYVRRALGAESGALEPSPEVWRRIRARIETPKQARRLRPRWALMQRGPAAILQGAAIAVLAVCIGLNFTQGLSTNVFTQPKAQQPPVTVRLEKPHGYPADALSVGQLMRLAEVSQPPPNIHGLLP